MDFFKDTLPFLRLSKYETPNLIDWRKSNNDIFSSNLYTWEVYYKSRAQLLMCENSICLDGFAHEQRF